MSHRWRFITAYLRKPTVIGAIAPSSRALASALCEPFRRYARPAKVLELGAGTGAFTRYLGSLLGEEDELDVCEVQPDFADILRSDVFRGADLAPAVADGRVRLLSFAVQEIDFEDRYDFVISGLPLTAFSLSDVEAVFDVIRRCLKPSGVFSYFEYIGLRKTSRLLSVGRPRSRIRLVSAYLRRNIRNHQFAGRVVLRNLPPAYARHLRFHA